MRRLLLLPAVALVALGWPVLATAQTTPGPATTDEVPVAPEGATVGAGWSSAATPVEGQLVGVTWEGDPATEFTVEVRETDGSWVAPTAVEGADEADEGSKDLARAAEVPANASEPVWVGDDVDAVRVKITSGQASDVAVAAVDADAGSAPSGSAGASALGITNLDGPQRYVFAAALFGLAAVLAVFALGFSPRPGRSRRLCAALVAALALGACAPVAPPGNGSQMPDISTRSVWGARPFACAGGPEYASKLKFAVVHHTVNSNSYSLNQVPQMMRSIQAYHMDANGYCDIAYHFIVDRFGWIYEGRAGGMTKPVIGGHAGGFNTASTGIALLGDYTNIQPGPEQWSGLVRLLRWRLTVGGVNPKAPWAQKVASSPCNCQNWPPGTTVTFSTSIVGHRDLDQTACPGNKMWPMLNLLVNHVAAGWVSTTTTSSTTATTLGSSGAGVTSTSTSTTLPPSTTTTSTSIPAP